MASLDTLQPRQVLTYDFRTEDVAKTAKLKDTVRMVQWNIERGAQLDAIIDTLRACDADIVVLQELDIHCRRSGSVNVPKRLAQALHAQVHFVYEFEELDDPARSAQNAVGPLSAPSTSSSVTSTQSTAAAGDPARRDRHFHGNAILSKGVTLREPTVIVHRAGLDWESKGRDVAEPRHGFRSVLRVLVSPRDRQPRSLPPLYVYCCHLEVFCGALMRVRQLSDCLRDAQALLLKAKAGAAQDNRFTYGEGDDTTPLPAFVIAGDMNTMAHGVVRFSPKYATDRMRLLSLGEQEACWWQRKVLSRGMGAVTRGCCPFSYRFPYFVLANVYEWVFNNRLVWSLLYGFDSSEQRDLDNTKVCFYDPADKASSVTLDNPAYHGFVRGKLDWLLLSNLTVVATALAPLETLVQRRAITDGKTVRAVQKVSGTTNTATVSRPDGYVLFNDQYKESDHKGLLVTVRQNAAGGPETVYPPYGATYTTSPCALAVFVASRVVSIGAIVLAVYCTVKAHEKKRL